MTLISTYECDYCKNRYDTQQECTACEQSHVQVDQIEEVLWDPITRDKTGIPYQINVKFMNGKTVFYRRN